MEPTTTPAATPVFTGLRYGLLLGVSWVIVDFLLRQVGFGVITYGIVTIAASVLVSVVAIVFAHRAFKQGHAGLLSYGQGFLIALIMVFISSMISALFNYLYVHYIDPDFVERMQEEMGTFMERNGVSQTDIDKGMARFAKMKGTFGQSLLSGLTNGLILGTILGALVSIFTKRSHPEFE